MAAERQDGFEEELVVRLGARAGAVGGIPPLAGLREAGRRRARRLTALRGAAAVVAVVLGVGALSQLGGGAGAAHPVGGPSSGPPSGAATGAADGGDWAAAGPIYGCTAGPTSLRTPGWTPPRPPAGQGSPGSSASSGGPSGFPSGLPSTGLPSTGASSSGVPFTGAPSSGLPSTGAPSSGAPSSGMPFTGLPTGRTWTFGTVTSEPSGHASPAFRPVGGFPIDPDLFQAARAVAELAVGPYRDQYFGACSDQATHTLYVMRKPGSDFDRAARARVDATKVRLEFRDAVGTRAELSALAQRITEEGTGYWKDRGVEIVSTQVCNDGAGVRVDVARPESARADILARYGSRVAEVVLTG